MANILPTEKKALIISMLAEDSSIRAIERITGVHRDTIMRLGVRVGEACKKLHDEKMRNLSATQIEVVGLREKSDTGKARHIWTKQL